MVPGAILTPWLRCVLGANFSLLLLQEVSHHLPPLLASNPESCQITGAPFSGVGLESLPQESPVGCS